MKGIYLLIEIWIVHSLFPAGNSEDLFTLHRQTGALVLRRNFHFSEEQQTYQIAVQASDLRAEPRVDRAMVRCEQSSG